MSVRMTLNETTMLPSRSPYFWRGGRGPVAARSAQSTSRHSLVGAAPANRYRPVRAVADGLAAAKGTIARLATRPGSTSMADPAWLALCRRAFQGSGCRPMILTMTAAVPDHPEVLRLRRVDLAGEAELPAGVGRCAGSELPLGCGCASACGSRRRGRGPAPPQCVGRQR